MSGNPFRKSGDNHNDRQSSRDTAATPRDETTRKVKRVQFVSPVTSPEIIPRQAWPDSAPVASDMPEISIAASDPAVSDLANAKGLASDEAGIDTRALLRGDLTGGGTIEFAATQPSISSSLAETPRSSASGAPINPFAKTLATMEPEQRAAAVQALSAKGTPEIAQPTPGRSTLDVDAFKRLLMTGTSGVNTTPADASKEEVSVAAKASSTSIDVPDAEPAHSSLQSASTSEPDQAMTSDSGSTVSGLSTHKPPPLPAHRHGKPVGPQTVDFDDFDSAFADLGIDPSSTTPQDVTRPSLSRSMSDLNKPLPEPPASSMNGLQISASSSEDPEPSPATTSQRSNEESLQRKIVPPPPPATRRQVQAKNRSPNLATPDRPAGRNRSGSNLSQISTQSEESMASRSSNRPAPPPPRNPAPVVAESAAAGQGEASTDQGPLTGTKMRPPPPPPSRQVAKPSQVARTPSTQSSSSLQNRRVSTYGGLAPPPPPPPRRGAARRPSEDATGRESRRSSGQSMISDRKDSVSSLRGELEPPVDENMKESTLPNVDFMADLDAFQKEVDALRAKALKGT